MSEKKIRIVLFALIASIIIITILGITLYFTTDLLKSKEALFQKYLFQNVQNIATVFDVSTGEKYIDYIRNNDYITVSFFMRIQTQDHVYKHIPAYNLHFFTAYFSGKNFLKTSIILRH